MLLPTCSIKRVVACVLLLNVGVSLAASIGLVLNFALLACIRHYLLRMIHLVPLRNHLILVLKMPIGAVLWHMELAL